MSSERERLIEAIRETPDDDAPRLVMADWFADQGGPENEARADFIRTQIDRARLPDDDERQSELQARELRLLKRWGAAWQGSHFGFRKCIFRRGFIEYAHLHLTHFLHHRRRLMALEPLRDVRLTGWHRADPGLVRRVAACEEWRHVETLRIHHQGPHKDPDGRLLPLLESPHLTGLKALHGTRFSFTDDERRRFESLPILGTVESVVWPDLASYPHSPRPWFADGVGDGRGRITSLDLTDLPYLSHESLSRFTEHPWWAGLGSLGVVGNRDVISGSVGRLPGNLTGLDLAHEPASPSFLGWLASLPLRDLRLFNCGVPPDALSRSLSDQGGWDLESLRIQDCRFDLGHLSALQRCKGAVRLRSLSVTDEDMDAEVARGLLSGTLAPSLRRLDLRLTEMDLDALGEGASLAGLRHLTLRAGSLPASELERLLASDRPQLVSLSASVDRLTVGLAEACCRLPHLARLSLSVAAWVPRARSLLEGHEPLAWLDIDDLNAGWDVGMQRAARAPERFAPLDGWEEWWPE